MRTVKDEDRAYSVEEHATYAPEEAQEMRVLHYLSLFIPHRLPARGSHVLWLGAHAALLWDCQASIAVHRHVAERCIHTPHACVAGRISRRRKAAGMVELALTLINCTSQIEASGSVNRSCQLVNMTSRVRNSAATSARTNGHALIAERLDVHPRA